MRFLSSTEPLPLGLPEQRASAGSWGHGTVIPIDTGLPSSIRDRAGFYAQNAFGIVRASTSGVAYSVDPARLLSPEQLNEIYVRCDDVRAAVDSVVRRIATWDWVISPNVDPSDDRYEAAMKECERLKLWLEKPTANDETFQEVLTAFVTDLLVQDAGALELVPKGSSLNGPLDEIAPLNGAEVHPIADQQGLITHYIQEPRVHNGTVAAIELQPEKVLYMRMFANTRSLEGIPILESLIYRVIALMRGAESVAGSLTDAMPGGLLVITGLIKEAADRVKASLGQKGGAADRLEIVTSQQPAAQGGIDYKWLEFKRLPRDLQVLELSNVFSRIVWRLFGVMPVEMGETDGMPRATAQVQLDASSSHLIGPILELLQAKINSRIISRQVASKWRDLVSFRWVMKRQMSAADGLSKAKELGEYVDRGILTRNEARKMHPEGPFAPIPGGDTPTVTVNGTIVPLAIALEAASAAGGDPSSTEPDPNEEGDDIEEIDDDSSPETDDDEAPEEEEEEEQQARPRPPLSLLPPGRALGRQGTREYRSILSGEAPEEWGSFGSVRTLDLRGLWNEIEGYTRDVLPIWEEARTATISELASVYKAEGFDAEARGRFMEALGRQIERLATRWEVSVANRYETVALEARARAGLWTAHSSDVERVRLRARMYREAAYTYLRADTGPLAALSREIGALLVAASDVRALPPRDLRQRFSMRAPVSTGADAGTVLAAVGAIWDGLRSRVSNWAGKLIELSYAVLSEELEIGASTGQAMGIEDSQPGETVEWWCEWVAAGGSQICADCQTYGSRGYQRLADLPTQPGGSTRCRSNCRCVLVIWTKAEIDSGRAHYMSAYNK